MKHPSISLDEVRRIAAERLQGSDVDVSGSVKWVGDGASLDLEPIKAAAAQIDGDLDAFVASGNSDKDAFEGAAAVPLYAALAPLSLDVLDDQGFWRYLSMAHLWTLTTWREPAFRKEEAEWSKYRVYIDGRRQSECVALRMYLRARIAERDGDFSLATDIPEATDLWRSHIVRVRTSYSPVLAQAILEEQRAARMNTEDVRAFAKRIQRVASNVVLHLYEPDEAASLVTELRS